jgi:hypothetical protein
MGNYSRLGGSDAGKRFAGKSQAAGYLKATTLPFAVSSTSGGGGHDPPVFIGIGVGLVSALNGQPSVVDNPPRRDRLMALLSCGAASIFPSPSARFRLAG